VRPLATAQFAHTLRRHRFVPLLSRPTLPRVTQPSGMDGPLCNVVKRNTAIKAGSKDRVKIQQQLGEDVFLAICLQMRNKYVFCPPTPHILPIPLHCVFCPGMWRPYKLYTSKILGQGVSTSSFFHSNGNSSMIEDIISPEFLFNYAQIRPYSIFEKSPFWNMFSFNIPVGLHYRI